MLLPFLREYDNVATFIAGSRAWTLREYLKKPHSPAENFLRWDTSTHSTERRYFDVQTYGEVFKVRERHLAILSLVSADVFQLPAQVFPRVDLLRCALRR